VTLLPTLLVVFFITDTFKALILSQLLLSIRLPITILLQLPITSSRKVMRSYANAGIEKFLLWGAAAVMIFLNLMLLKSAVF